MPIKAIPFFSPTVSLRPDDSMLDSLRLMLEKQINHAPICDASGVFIGLISTNAILQALIPASAKAEGGLSNLKFVGDGMGMLTSHLRDLAHLKVVDFANKDIPALHEDSPILEATLRLAHSTEPLPVVGKDGKLLGVISRRALLAHFLAQRTD
ncbi:MAG: CBS domain-containing protein [Sulfuricella sp.]|nr:CBS domain-containing protein [Sulfuricella sp.]